jgi:hypothetical protein
MPTTRRKHLEYVLRTHADVYARGTDRSTDGLEHNAIIAAEHIPSLAQPLDARRFHVTTEPSAFGQPWNRSTVTNNGETEGQETSLERTASDKCAQALQRCCRERD